DTTGLSPRRAGARASSSRTVRAPCYRRCCSGRSARYTRAPGARFASECEGDHEGRPGTGRTAGRRLAVILPFQTDAEIEGAIPQIGQHLGAGKLLAYPTETVYGLGSGPTVQALAA